jgi:hypothetical protein
MDASIQGATIGIGIMAFGLIVCSIRDQCQKINCRKKAQTKKEEPVLLPKLFLKKQSSLRDFYKKNTTHSR